MICSPERCPARVAVGEGAGARGIQSGDVAMCSSMRVGVGEGAEACISINFGRHGALLGSSVAFGSGCGVPRKAPLCPLRLLADPFGCATAFRWPLSISFSRYTLPTKPRFTT